MANEITRGRRKLMTPQESQLLSRTPPRGRPSARHPPPKGEGIRRRRFLQLAAAGAAVPLLPPVALPQSAPRVRYPAKPVRIIVGFAAGGVTDITARLMGQWLTERMGQPFLIENRPGAATNIATDAAIRAAPDGYTLLLAYSANAINATLYDNLSFNFMRDAVPVASIGVTPLVMVVNLSFPATTVSGFIAHAKANPGRINIASSGVGSPPHVAGELFKAMAGIDMVHVPYRGDGPAISDLLGGQVQVYFSTLPGAVEHIRSGSLRALAVTSAKRTPALAGVATVAELLPGFEASVWDGLAAPPHTPAAIVERLNGEVNGSLADPRMMARLAEIGITPLPGSPGDFATLIAAETQKWGRVVRAANIKVD